MQNPTAHVIGALHIYIQRNLMDVWLEPQQLPELLQTAQKYTTQLRFRVGEGDLEILKSQPRENWFMLC